MQEFLIDNVLSQARKECGTLEEENPELFWPHAFEVAAKRCNVRR